MFVKTFLGTLSLRKTTTSTTYWDDNPFFVAMWRRMSRKVFLCNISFFGPLQQNLL